MKRPQFLCSCGYPIHFRFWLVCEIGLLIFRLADMFERCGWALCACKFEDIGTRRERIAFAITRACWSVAAWIYEVRTAVGYLEGRMYIENREKVWDWP